MSNDAQDGSHRLGSKHMCSATNFAIKCYYKKVGELNFVIWKKFGSGCDKSHVSKYLLLVQ